MDGWHNNILKYYREYKRGRDGIRFIFVSCRSTVVTWDIFVRNLFTTARTRVNLKCDIINNICKDCKGITRFSRVLRNGRILYG